MTQSEQKAIVASAAIDALIEHGEIFSGMKIGLGTGSTAEPAVRHLAKRIADGTLKDVKAVVTSFGTQNLCEELEIPVFSMNDKIIGGHLDLTIDGADEVDPFNNVIKGGGAALLREKIVAYNSSKFVIVADSTKIVKTLGTGFRLPVEIIGEARVPVIAALNALGAECFLREGVRKCGPVITDNGNQLLDIVWKEPVDPAEMEDKINSIVGVVENGFFTKNKPTVFTMNEDTKVIARQV
ncbi:MAG: ribose-5-phosphate isomerase RpiA [Lachnospiraceae bacterium]|nr:ribose-5-phosphate isomerase RpiA [Lachnospiraceae bacterium]MBR5677981.1 ribose-5-phosphate isomerase RpiA [Paludibacteraceae bacterium]